MAQSATKASTSKPPAKAAPSPVTVTTKKPSEDKVKSEPQEANIPPRKASTATKSGGLDWSKAKPVNAAKSAPKKASSFSAAKPVAASQEKGKRKERAASVSSSTTSEPKPKVHAVSYLTAPLLMTIRSVASKGLPHRLMMTNWRVGNHQSQRLDFRFPLFVPRMAFYYRTRKRTCRRRLFAARRKAMRR